jgi:uridine kinase
MEHIIDQIIENNPNKIIILDYVLLPKTKYFVASDLRIWVDAPYETRLERVIKRAIQERNITPDYFKKRDASGIDYEEGKYDIVINNVNKEKTQEEVKLVYEKSIIRR